MTSMGGKWTPGPWRLRTRNGVHEIIGTRHPDIGEPPVAFQAVYGRGRGHQFFIDECLATAHLLRAALELYEALEEMVAHCTSCAGSGLFSRKPEVKCPECLRARTALKHARGETS